MLASLVPLERDVGLCAEWQVITADAPFFEVTKKIHNAMQGMEVEIGEEELCDYLSHNAETAGALEGEWDVIVVHDPQPAAVRSFAGDRGSRWVWRCHIDSSAPHDPVWQFLRPFVEKHDHAVFTMDRVHSPRSADPDLHAGAGNRPVDIQEPSPAGVLGARDGERAGYRAHPAPAAAGLPL